MESAAQNKTTTTTKLSTSLETTTMTMECRGGYSVAVGRTDSTCVDQEY